MVYLIIGLCIIFCIGVLISKDDYSKFLFWFIISGLFILLFIFNLCHLHNIKHILYNL